MFHNLSLTIKMNRVDRIKYREKGSATIVLIAR